jgi:hypothetical protein
MILIRQQLRAHIIEGCGGNNFESSNKDIVGAIKTIHNIILEFIIINGLPDSSKFRSKPFHLGDILLGCHVKLVGVGECTTDVGNP